MAVCLPDAPAVVDADDGSSTSSVFRATAVDAAAFAPPYCPHPRPWQRVPVPATFATLYATGAGFRKIWKRVGGIPLSTADCRYAAAVNELRADGSGPRKRCRAEPYVPVWGDVLWKQAGSEQTGGLDWALAKESVDAAKHTTIAHGYSPQRQGHSKRATFSIDALRFVPRKRNSRRVMLPRSTSDHCAVAPAETDATPEAAAEAIASSPTKNAAEETIGELSIPVPALDDQSILSEADAEHITKRVKRRPGRRFSVSFEQPSQDNKTGATPSPTKASVRRARKSLPARWCPVSLERHMSVSAPAPLATLSETSIMEEQPDGDEEHSIAENVSLLSELPMVVFDQPAPEEGDAAYEATLLDTERQVSMQNARRRETWTFTDAPGGRRRSMFVDACLGEEKARPTRRRQSMMPAFPAKNAEKATPRTGKPTKTNRRHTLHPSTTFDFQFVSPSPVGKVRDDGSPVTNFSVTTPTKPRALSGRASLDSTVVVDVRTNLDIFGSGPPVQASHVSSPGADEREEALDMSTPKVTVTPADDDKPIESNEPAPSASDVVAEEKPHSTIAEVASDILDEAADGPDTPRSDDNSIGSPASGTEQSPSRLYDRVEDFDASRLVSDQPSLELTESLLQPLSDMASTPSENGSDCSSVATLEDIWQSPLSPVLESVSVGPANGKLEDSPYDVVIDDDTATTSMDLDVVIGENDFLSPVSEPITVDDTADLDYSPADNDGSLSPSPSKEEDGIDFDATATDEAAEEAEFESPAVGDDATVTMTLDVNDMDDEQQYSAHDDSETEMLRKFVTRVQADKSAKAAAAAAAATTVVTSSHPTSANTAALAKSRVHSRQKRRSGSTGSVASASGSPISKRETAQISAKPLSSPLDSLRNNRVPLGMKDHNMSPSPVKRKAKGFLGMGDKTQQVSEELLSKPSLDDTMPPRPKRRRKKMEADTGSIFNPEFAAAPLSSAGHTESSSEHGGLRRSKRTRSQTPLKTASNAAGNSALSHIPIRLPGSLNLGADEGGMLASGTRPNGMTDKELATVTRVNTRKNKGKAEAPCVFLARQAEDATSMASLETLSSVFDSPKTKGKEHDKDMGKPARKGPSSSKTAKNVRWAEVLARFQETDKAPAAEPRPVVSVFKAKENAATAPEAVVPADATPLDSNAVPEDAVLAALGVSKEGAAGESAPSTIDTPASTAGVRQLDGNAVETDVATKAEKKAIPRRTTRVSRLPPPTPRKAIAAAAAAKVQSAEASKPAGPLRTASGPSTPRPRMATRRTKILSMGVSGNGTPAPQRRINRA